MSCFRVDFLCASAVNVLAPYVSGGKRSFNVLLRLKKKALILPAGTVLVPENRMSAFAH